MPATVPASSVCKTIPVHHRTIVSAAAVATGGCKGHANCTKLFEAKITCSLQYVNATATETTQDALLVLKPVEHSHHSSTCCGRKLGSEAER